MEPLQRAPIPSTSVSPVSAIKIVEMFTHYAVCGGEKIDLIREQMKEKHASSSF
jgi:hypothetical protein